jgi:lipid-binding SYLF domain-containing protein
MVRLRDVFHERRGTEIPRSVARLEIGVGPSVVVVDQGLGKKLSSTTLTQDVYVFIFGQKGLMAGIGIEGSKITKKQ